MSTSSLNRRFPLFLVVAVGTTGCQSGAAPEPSGRQSSASDQDKTNTAQPKQRESYDKGSPKTAREAPKKPSQAKGEVTAKPVASVTASPGDPVSGKFTVEDATKGLGPGKDLTATIKTTKGALECELWPDKAPLTVANFVGLARGLRPWKNGEGKWVTKPLYDGTPFHRVIPGFMIQGGDPAGTGAGGPGYVIPDEIWEGARHDERGLLCMANRGPNTNGSQFFIMDGKASHLDGGYTIFGKCGPDSVIEAIAKVERRGDRAVEPAKIEKITVKRK